MVTTIASPAATAADTAPLSPREAEVLALAAQGLTDEQIARRVQLHVSTVSSHMHRLRRKLDAANRAHAVAIGLHLGLITLDHPTKPTPAAAAVVALDEHASLSEDSDTARLWRLLPTPAPWALTRRSWPTRSAGLARGCTTTDLLAYIDLVRRMCAPSTINALAERLRGTELPPASTLGWHRPRPAGNSIPRDRDRRGWRLRRPSRNRCVMAAPRRSRRPARHHSNTPDDQEEIPS